MDYESSICFSPDIPERLNEKAFSIDKRLYLFAYYEPKEYIENESYRSKFITATVNLYGLFWDCCPFMRKLLGSGNSILLNNWTQIQLDFQNLRNTISAFRSIFCHNNSDIYPLNAVHFELAEQWIFSQCGISKDLSDLTDGEWEKLLYALHCQADAFISSVESNIDGISSTSDVLRRNRTINWWIEAIAGSYIINKDYLLNAMAGMYQIYLMNAHSSPAPNVSLRDQTISWLCNHCNVVDREKWYITWIDKGIRQVTQSKVHKVLLDWPNLWAIRNGMSPADCDEAPLPGSDFFRILASDVDNFARNPQLGYHP